MVKNTISLHMKKYIKEIPKVLEQGLRRAMQHGADLTKTQSDFPIRTGMLVGSLNSGDANQILETTTSKNKIVGYMGSNLSYAAAVEYGHSELIAKKGSAFHWIGEDGLDVFATRIRPVAGRFVFTKGFESGKKDYQDILDDTVKEYINASRA